MIDINNLITDNLEVWSSAIQHKKTTGRGSSKKIRLVGINRLRDLIIELALQGKLVKQDANDTPASYLIDEIKKKRVELTKKKLVKRQSTKVNYELLEKPYAIPSNWCWSSIGELCEIAPKNDLGDDIEASFIPMPLISTSYSGEHDQETKKWGEIKKGFTHFADGDIALAKITPCFENSKAAIFQGLKNGVGSGTTELHVARPLVKKVNSRYLLLFLKSPLFLSEGESKMTGTAGQKRVPKDFFTTYSLPLAPVEEQSRIVSKVDELMVLCDKLEQQTEASIDAHKLLVEELLSTLFLPAEGSNSENAQAFEQNWARIAEHFDLLFTTEHSIEQLKQTILELAVLGKLVPQNSDNDSAKSNLRKIAIKRQEQIKNKMIKKPKPLSDIGNEDMVFDLPIGWAWSRLGEFAEVKGGKRLPKGHQLTTQDTGLVYIRVTDMKNGTVNTGSLQYLQPESQELIKQYTISSNDLYITIAGTIGDVGFIPEELSGANLTENAAKIIFDDVNIKWLKLVLSSPYLQGQFQDKTNKLAQPKLALHRILSAVLAIPPTEEQGLIAKKVDSLFKICEQLSLLISQTEKIQVQLSEAVIEQALS